MKLSKNKKNSFFLKYFFIFSGVILVSFMVIGLSLMIFVTNYMSTEVLNETKNHARELASFTSGLLTSETATENPEAAVLLMCQNVDVIAKTTGNDVFICNVNGHIEICPETLSDYKLEENKHCEIHKKIQIPYTYVHRVKNGQVSEFSTLGTSYDTYNAVAMEPLYIENSFYGFCVVASPITGNFLSGLKQVFVVFLISAAIALVLVTIAVYFMTGKIAKPISNLETATTLYSSGDFSYRVPEIDSDDELAHLITKFNSMATALSQLENSRRSFVANVSHEFKTPMTTIGGFINGILDGTIPPEKQEHYLNIVSSEINRLSKMVNMMLNISKIETGNVEMTFDTVDVSDTLINTLLGLEQIISQKNIEVIGVDELEPLLIRADSAMLDQLIYNLVENAVKFTNNNGKIKIDATTDKNHIYFAITNSGKGIPEKDLEKVFDRFFKVDQSRSTDTKSTGLGLYLVKSIIGLHKGSITVESEEDSFTRFTVKLPK